MIWHREQILAYELAKALIPKPKVSVWMVMLPFLFLFFMQDLKKYKAGIRNFADGFLKNKKIALDLAFNAVRERISHEAALAAFAADAKPVFADQSDLHEKQMNEIAGLMTHYRCLLNGRGKTCEELLKNAYGAAGKYRRFLETLEALENEVIQAASKLNPPDGDSQELVKLMQTAARRIRRRECERIFQV